MSDLVRGRVSAEFTVFIAIRQTTQTMRCRPELRIIRDVASGESAPLRTQHDREHREEHGRGETFDEIIGHRGETAEDEDRLQASCANSFPQRDDARNRRERNARDSAG